MTRRYICPACRQRRGVDIDFGYPTPELFDLAERGEAVIGGCVLPLIGEPERQCLACGHRWAIRRRR
ncbi:hypothetical protein [Sphingomonas corticis]|jgi:hypothetical protein|uniref:Uncharacterized protein n=1 Tax=Sphingomonas corticis TaxID=2722791 RepID=A0ABX1CS86_9SPHN|nr:hypothetical protein [Sphingomonas corticis]NJR80364.1 hypothetical protein [Sphingomonas corticis]